ncbi:MAG TPA: ankyrin repeat domain-containing protein, partial [Candidatus Babeliaceae bacterium]|nr:ankyrin repeat domain-containing protein [Candidatus Babeliaceae bacterium]
MLSIVFALLFALSQIFMASGMVTKIQQKCLGNLKSSSNRASLREAVKYLSLPAADRLLEIGVDINGEESEIKQDYGKKIDKFGDEHWGCWNTVVHHDSLLTEHVKQKNLAQVTYLLEHGANPLEISSTDRRAVSDLLRNGYPELRGGDAHGLLRDIVRYYELLWSDAQGQALLECFHGGIPLEIIVKIAELINPEIAQILNYGEVSKSEKFWSYPKGQALVQCRRAGLPLEIVKKIASYVDGKTEKLLIHDKSTPLIKAIEEGLPSMAQLLIESGADPSNPNNNLETPLDIAQKLAFHAKHNAMCQY